MDVSIHAVSPALSVVAAGCCRRLGLLGQRRVDMGKRQRSERYDRAEYIFGKLPSSASL